MKRLIIFFCALSVIFFGATVAAKTIKVTVSVDKKITQKMTILGTGLSVNNKSRGSMGSSARKQGPAPAKYSFGFRPLRGKDVSCGSAILRRDSHVVLYFRRDGRCTNKVFPQ